ncbi:MAG TPA: SET domain-containing protein-lysine N-methyltransferase [Candidatus Pacearchaeota archaeon]|nr:SET domain protein [archaeon BMS3Abin17]HDK41977.1 SET domain-containing protein-lysine N-methyltransferase [Candidatus Pacearchaeota archaeon]HDZ61470.1 SET domain-containing protein-lysine N-methyltransferase [Candidatus Pacearchaeota archaeon]
MENKFVIKNSRIEGKGAFASRDIKKGEIIFNWDTSNKLTKEQVKNLPKKDKNYVVKIKKEYFLLNPPERYVNHSCDANTYVHNFCDVAKKDIKGGGKITSNYYEKGEQSIVNIDCKCGSKNCIRTIKGEFDNDNKTNM